MSTRIADAAGSRITSRQASALDTASTQCYPCVVMPPFESDGNLPPGIHWVDWSEFVVRYGTTDYRRQLMRGLKAALDSLKGAGCMSVYVDGSFVTSKVVPGDYDACWDETGVKLALLDPALRTFANRRLAQKIKFMGELFPASDAADGQGATFLAFFQIDKATGGSKGIVAIDLRRMP